MRAKVGPLGRPEDGEAIRPGRGGSIKPAAVCAAIPSWPRRVRLAEQDSVQICDSRADWRERMLDPSFTLSASIHLLFAIVQEDGARLFNAGMGSVQCLLLALRCRSETSAFRSRTVLERTGSPHSRSDVDDPSGHRRAADLISGLSGDCRAAERRIHHKEDTRLLTNPSPSAWPPRVSDRVAGCPGCKWISVRVSVAVGTCSVVSVRCMPVRPWPR